MQSLLACLCLLVLVAAVLPQVRSRRSRRLRLASLALRQGWTYAPADPWDLPGEIETLWLGSWGHDRRCRDVFSVPTQAGSLWLVQFSRQMASGRHRRTERFAVALVRTHAFFGGITILPSTWLFAPADPFSRYQSVPVPDAVNASACRVWAERPAADRPVISLLCGLVLQLPRAAGIEVRGSVAAVYWPLTQPGEAQDFLDLQTAGRWLLDLLESADGKRAAPAGV